MVLILILFTAETPRTQRTIIFPLAGGAAKGKPLVASRTELPRRRRQRFYKIGISRFYKKSLCILCASAVSMFYKRLKGSRKPTAPPA
jgi:hypothetical protein